MPDEGSTARGPVLMPLDYMSSKMRITAITQETPDVKTFRLVFCDSQENDKFEFRAGQFGLYSVFGAGEATFCISSSPTRRAPAWSPGNSIS
jgi:NAD(P)H-flavin reductase